MSFLIGLKKTLFCVVNKNTYHVDGDRRVREGREKRGPEAEVQRRREPGEIEKNFATFCYILQ